MKRSTHPAVEVGEVFKDDGKNIKDLILDSILPDIQR